MDEQETNKDLQEKLSLAEKERDEYLSGWKRAKADLINARKEWEEQLKSLGDFAKAEFVRQFLPVLDALEMAGDVAGWQEIKKLIGAIFKQNGIEEIAALGQPFDPVYHETVEAGEGQEHEIIEVLQKGYKMNGRVIRAAKVKVGKSANSESSSN